MLGITRLSLHDYSGAIEDYNAAIALNPKCGGYYSNRGQAESSLKKAPEALADYNLAIQLDPVNAQAYFNRGSLKGLFLTNCVEAVADYTKAIELHNDTHEEDFNCMRGFAKHELNDYAGEITDYNNA